jgi:hypothetical protein
MFGLLLRACAITFVGLMLTACGTRPKPMPEVQEIYEIRDVAVTANAGISRTLITGIKQRLDEAIHDTIRPAPLPRAVMNINIVGLAKTAAYDGIRAETEVSVMLTDVTSGQPLLVRSFLIYSFSISSRDVSESAAEAIASRIRVEYALTQPAIRKLPTPTRLSTRMNDDTLLPLGAHKDKPLVIPLKTAPVVGADQDPVLNSRTKIAPENQGMTVPDNKAVIVDTKSKASAPAENAVEAGAKVKVVIKPKSAEPASSEPCVETMDNKC